MSAAALVSLVILAPHPGDVQALQRMFPDPVPRESVQMAVRAIDSLSFFEVQRTSEPAADQVAVHLRRQYPVERVRFEGNLSFLDSVLHAALSLRPESARDTEALERLVFDLERFYRLQGFLDVQVEHQVLLQEYTADVQLRINEGAQYLLADLARLDTGDLPAAFPDTGDFFELGRMQDVLEHWRRDRVEQGFVEARYRLSFERLEGELSAFNLRHPLRSMASLARGPNCARVYVQMDAGPRYELYIDGPDRLDTAEVRRVLRLDRRALIDAFEVELMQQDLHQWLEAEGYRVNQVQGSIQGLQLRFAIDARRPQVQGWDVQATLWTGRLRERLGAILGPGKAQFEVRQLRQARRQLESELVSRGMDARVELELPRDDVGMAQFRVQLPIPVGLLQVHIEDGLALNDTQRNAEAHMRELIRQDPLLLRSPERVERLVAQWYRDRGYRRASARAAYEFLDAWVAIHLRVQPGPQFSLREPLRLGIQRSSDGFVRRLEAIPDDGIARGSWVDQVRSRVEGQQVFSYSRVHALEVGSEVQPVLEVQERDGFFGAVSLGYDSERGPQAQAEIGRTHVMGRGGQVLLRRRQSEDETLSMLQYEDPYSFGLPVDTAWSIQQRDRRFDNWDLRQEGVGLGLSWPWKPGWHLQASYAYDVLGYSDVDPRLIEGLEYDDKAKYHSLGASLHRDERDNPAMPSSGWEAYAHAAYSFATGGRSADYLRSQFMGSFYIPLHERWVLAAHGEYGLISRLSDDRPIPLEQRFLLGGSQSIRGFAAESVGVRTPAGVEIGGLVMQLGSVEIRHRLQAMPDFELVGFYDIGIVDDSVLVPSNTEVSSGIGLGLRYRTLVGPIRLDLASPLSGREDGDSSWQLYFTLGYSF